MWMFDYRAEWLDQVLSFAGLLCSLKAKQKSGSTSHKLDRPCEAFTLEGERKEILPF